MHTTLLTMMSATMAPGRRRDGRNRCWHASSIAGDTFEQRRKFAVRGLPSRLTPSASSYSVSLSKANTNGIGLRTAHTIATDVFGDTAAIG